MQAPPPHDEDDRWRELSRYGVLDTPPEPSLDRITRLAARVLKMPVVLLTFVDRERTWIKSAHGTGRFEGPREESFCARAILEPDAPLIVPDTTRDERFAGIPLVTGPPHFRFYAGVPLVSPRRQCLGTFCVLDTRPRRFSSRDTATLKELAGLVMDELDLRLTATRSQNELDERRRADTNLRAVRDELETRVQQRTAALAAAESRYRSIFENAVEGIYQTLPGGGFLSVNPALARLLGYASPEALLAALDSPGHLYARPDRRAEFEQRMREDGALFNWESEVSRADGSRIWVSENARAIRDEDGEILRYEGTFEDITARRIAEEALQRAHEELEDRVRERTAELAMLNGTLRQHILERECAESAARRSESKFRALIENAQDLISVLTPDGIILYQSPSIEHMLGYPPDDLLGQNAFDALLHPDDHEAVRRCATQIVEHGARYVRHEARYRHRNGSWRLLESVGTLTPPDSPVIGLVVNSRDITERRRTELQNEARAREQTAVAELGRYALENLELPAILDKTAELVARALQVPYSTINEILPGSDKLLIRAGVGWRAGTVGGLLVDNWRTRLPDTADAAVEEPLLIEDLDRNGQYPVLTELDGGTRPRSAVSVVIHRGGRRFGTLCALSPEPGRFDAQDAAFLQTVADLLSTIIESERHAVASREVDARFQRIVANTPGMVYQYLLHPDGTMTVPFVSDGCRQIYGLEAEELRAHPGRLIESVHPEDIRSHVAALAISARMMTPCHWEGRLLLPSGAIRWVTSRSRPERQPNGDIIWDGLVFDISELKTAQEAMLAAKEEAEKANRAKSEFLSRMSHELRTPLNAILGFGQLLGLEQLTPVQSSSVDQILKGGRHLLDLINEVLDIARIEAGSMELTLESVEIAPLLSEALLFVKPLAEQCRVHFFNHASTEQLVACADRGRLHQVLLNLLSNAVKYNREGGGVRVACTRFGDGKVRISVGDTGPGLKPDEVARLFTPFQRLGAPQRGIEGTGIGLTICKSLTEAMGGAISVESVPGEGSTFFVDLPAAPAELSPVARPVESLPLSPLLLPATRTVLLIDDQAANVSLIERVLAIRSDLRLLTALDGHTGLAEARKHHPDLILLDLHLPDIAGDEVMRRLHNEARTRTIPVVVLSADATPAQITRLRELGVREYLTKPFKIKELLTAVDLGLSPLATAAPERAFHPLPVVPHAMNDDPKILIIDDEEANVALLEAILRRIGGYRTRSTTDSRQALALTQEFGPDLILLDLSMPHLDGYAVMAQLQPLRATAGYLPILVLTADVTVQAKRRALSGGANDFLIKPVENEEVVLRCKNLLETRALHIALQGQNVLLEEKVRQRTQELEQTLTELKASQQHQVEQERLRALGEMSSGIAHDFNDQLTVLVGYTELLLLNDARMLSNRPMAARYLQTVRTAAHDSAAIVGRLREFSRHREAQDVFLPINLPRLVQETATLTQPRWRNQSRAAGRPINVRLELNPLPDVPGNAAELREVVTNLIFNAVDAMPHGGDITLRTRRAGAGAVAFEVADTGIGMSEEVRRRCLEPFFTTKESASGGLGLSVVYGIIQRHDGNLDILTELGKGTTISVRLPVAVAGTQTGSPETPAAETVQSGKHLHVLLVEDDPRVCELVSEYLRRDEHEVSTAVNGREGLEKFDAGHFDLVVTDLALDEMNGEQLAAAIKERATACPVILLTGFADSLLDRHQKPAGIDIILRKPLLPADLWRAVAQVMTAALPAVS